jgi:hypothetical protein
MVDSQYLLLSRQKNTDARVHPKAIASGSARERDRLRSNDEGQFAKN